MNKKSLVLFFSVLVLLSLGAYYIMASDQNKGIQTLAVTTETGDSVIGATSGWITNVGTGVNLTVTTDDDGVTNFTNLTFTFDETNYSWFAIATGGNGNPENISSHPDPETILGLTNLTYYSSGDAWAIWTCQNVSGTNEAESSGKINCYATDTAAALGTNISDSTLVLTLNMSALGTQEAKANITVEIANASAGAENMTSITIGIDTMEPRLIEINISDGNTTYINATWGGGYTLRTGLWTIQAVIEDATLNTGAILAYNCNLTNASWSTTEWVGATGTSLVGVTNIIGAAGVIDELYNNHRGWISTTIDCTTTVPTQSVNMSNESLSFAFLANDSFNHYRVLNDTSDSSLNGPFNIWYDDGDILPVIAKVNVSQTTQSLSDSTNSISKVLDSATTSGAAELDGSSDYLKASIVTFTIDLNGGQRPESVMILWNSFENSTSRDAAAVNSINIGSGSYDGLDLTNLEEGLNLDATNAEVLWSAQKDTTFDIDTYNSTATYNVTLDLGTNSSKYFVFYVLANNTGSNYTALAGPYRFQLDGAGPTMTMTSPTDRSITPRASITYSCKAADDLSGAYRIRWQLVKPGSYGTISTNFAALGAENTQSKTFSGDDTMYPGEYSVKCIGVDNVGNEITHTSSTSETFSVHYSTGGAGEGASGGSVADVDLSTSEEITITEKQGTISTFTLDGTTVHTITIKTVDEVAGTVTIVIESDPITITLKIGETKEVDIDVDGTNDISVTLNKITDGAADITTKRLTPLPEQKPTEEVPPTEKPAEEIPTAPEAASKTWLWILIIVIIVVIGVGYWFMKKK